MATANQISIYKEARKHSFLPRGALISHKSSMKAGWSNWMEIQPQYTQPNATMQWHKFKSGELLLTGAQSSKSLADWHRGGWDSMQNLSAVMWAGSTFTQVNTCPQWLLRVTRNSKEGSESLTLRGQCVCSLISTWSLHLNCHWYAVLNIQATQGKIWVECSYKMGNSP